KARAFLLFRESAKERLERSGGVSGGTSRTGALFPGAATYAGRGLRAVTRWDFGGPVRKERRRRGRRSFCQRAHYRAHRRRLGSERPVHSRQRAWCLAADSAKSLGCSNAVVG